MVNPVSIHDEKAWEDTLSSNANRLRVAQLISRADTIGGAQRHVLELAEALTERGHHLIVVTGPGQPFSELLAKSGIEHHQVSSLTTEFGPSSIRRDLASFRELDNLMKNFAPDIICCHSTKAGILGRVLAKKSGIANTYTLHGLTFSPGVRPLRRILGWGLEAAMRPFNDQIIAVSEYDAALAKRFKISRPDRMTAIRNSVIDSEDRAESSTDSKVRLVMPARLDNQKDHELLLRALAQVESTDWHLQMLGDGPLQASLEQLSATLGLQDRVSFLGLVPDVSPYLREADLLVLISHYEGLPLSILEGLRMGLPVVASDVGGVSEAVIDRVNGRLVAAGDQEQLAVAFGELFSSPETVGAMAIESRKLYERRFSFDGFVQATEAVYLQAAGASRGDSA